MQNQNVRRRVYILNAALLVFIVLLIGFALFERNNVVNVNGAQLVQDIEPEVVIPPADLVRISWGAVFAGAIIALVVQLTLNLLALSVGAMTINPQYDEETARPKDIAIGGAIYVAASTLMSLFIGGWVAARFAGTPNDLDGILHGVLTWGVVTLVSVFLLMTALGRIISGTANLIGHGLNLAGRLTEGVMRGAAGVTQAAMQGVANVASGVAQATGGVARGVRDTVESGADNLPYAVSNLADAARSEINRHPELRRALQDVENVVRQEIDNHPEVRDALERQQLSRDMIEFEARQLLREAGISPMELQSRAQDVVEDVSDATRVAVQQASHQDFEGAWETIQLAMRHVLREGQTAVSDIDRDALVNVLKSRANMTEEEARQTVQRWEANYNEVKQQTMEIRQQVEQRLNEMRMEAERKVEEVRRELEEQARQAQREAERLAREAAQATSDTIARLAGAVFAAMVIGAMAAGVGGWLGTPTEVETVEVDTTPETYVPSAPVVYLDDAG